jgi:hypothetical protein
LHPIEINNDTGAGDVFAGGVIAGILSPRLLIHQPAPIRLGASLARERLKSIDFPTERISLETSNFFVRHQRNEHYNRRQRIKVLWEQYGTHLVSFSLGVLSSIIASIFFILL